MVELLQVFIDFLGLLLHLPLLQFVLFIQILQLLFQFALLLLRMDLDLLVVPLGLSLGLLLLDQQRQLFTLFLHRNDLLMVLLENFVFFSLLLFGLFEF